MESKILEVVISEIAINSLEQIYIYGIETFSYNSATVFLEELYNKIYQLSTEYLLHVECSFLLTKTHIYRNIIYGNYLVVYRVTNKRVEVLNVFHSSRKPSKIAAAKKIRI